MNKTDPESMSESTMFARSAAVTRSLLGWGVIAGVFYLVVGVVQGVVRDGFSFTEHALSLLMLGEGGWIQSANLIITGLMVVAAAAGFSRIMAPDGLKAPGILLGIYGVALVGSGIFPPDPVDGFPDPGSTAEATNSGIMHLVFGGIGFLALSAAALVVAGWMARKGDTSLAVLSRLGGLVVLVGFLVGAALASSAIGVILLWIAVVTGWAWLAVTSIKLYQTVPQPDLATR